MGNIFSDGYSGFDFEYDSFAGAIVILSGLSISLLIQCAIALNTMIQMRHHHAAVPSVNMCFALNFLSAFCLTAGGILYRVWYHRHPYRYDILHFIMVLSYGIFFWSLLVTFVLRLYITFKPSSYRMSNKLIIMFTVIIVLLAIGLPTCCALFIFIETWGEIKLFLGYGMAFALFCLYVLGCILAVYFFVSNLSKVAKSREITLRNLSITPQEIKLDEQQQRMSDLSAKYMTLFGFAMGSSCLFLALGLSVSYNSGFRGVLITIDVTVNLWCAYLQFPFAKKHYTRCCGRCHERCRSRRLQKTRKMVHRHSVVMARKRASADPESGSKHRVRSHSPTNSQ